MYFVTDRSFDSLLFCTANDAILVRRDVTDCGTGNERASPSFAFAIFFGDGFFFYSTAGTWRIVVQSSCSFLFSCSLIYRSVCVPGSWRVIVGKRKGGRRQDKKGKPWRGTKKLNKKRATPRQFWQQPQLNVIPSHFPDASLLVIT